MLGCRGYARDGHTALRLLRLPPLVQARGPRLILRSIAGADLPRLRRPGRWPQPEVQAAATRRSGTMAQGARPGGRRLLLLGRPLSRTPERGSRLPATAEA